MAYSHEQLVINALAKARYGRLSLAKLATSLGAGWTIEEARQLVEKLDERDDCPVALVKGGVQYIGTERGAKPGLYKATAQYLPKWAERNVMRHMSVLHTSRSPLFQGVWSEPDMVARFPPEGDCGTIGDLRSARGRTTRGLRRALRLSGLRDGARG